MEDFDGGKEWGITEIWENQVVKVRGRKDPNPTNSGGPGVSSSPSEGGFYSVKC